MTQSIEKIPVESALYKKTDKVYPREVKGTFQSLRAVCVWGLLGLYYGLPWLSWGDRQAVLFDLPARKFHIFFLTFWPQDFFFLALLLLIAALSLFFFTAIAGRVWCGFACPQTVWTETFIWLERWVEGSRAKQIKLAAAPWSLNKVYKRVAKHFLWITFSLFTGLTFVGYFEPISQLFADFFTLNVAGWSLFWVLFYGFATYGNAGFMREQVCKYMCPYARFQSAMFDSNTLIIAYDEKRGEPRSRGKRRKSRDPITSQGDCIDCGICVQACPTGIDIRDGLQYECIACAACIDGCDQVMDRVGLPRGLIKYSTQAQNPEQSHSLLKVVLRPRVIIYAVLLLGIMAAFIVSLANRASFQVDILRDRNALYRWSESGEIENSYQARVMNKSQIDQTYYVSLNGLQQARVGWVKNSAAGQSRVVKSGEIGEFKLLVRLPADAEYQRVQNIRFTFSEARRDAENSNRPVIEESRFWGPAQQ